MRSDPVAVTVDVGNGVRALEVAATRPERRVEVTTGRTIVEVAEVTRGGTRVHTARFMTSRESWRSSSTRLSAPSRGANGERSSLVVAWPSE